MTRRFALSGKDKRAMNFSMRLSFAVGILTLGIKGYAYWMTRSTAILSDVSESVIHIFAVGFAAYSMWLSLKPPDKDHLYGHDKVGFFSAGFEGALIMSAACFILYESIRKLLFGFQLENLGAGMGFILSVIAINLLLGLHLIRKGKQFKSIVLEANGKHLMTDCWTSFGALIALILVQTTGMPIFDPVIAILAALNILVTGWYLVRRSVSGLMDRADLAFHKKIYDLLEREAKKRDLEFHHLRHRQSGQKIFIEFHLLFPKNIPLVSAHEIASKIESVLKESLDIESDIFTHLEPKDHHDATHKKYGLSI